MSGQHCANYDVERETVHCYPRNVDPCYTSTSSRETLRFSGNKIHCSPWDQPLSVRYCTMMNILFSLFLSCNCCWRIWCWILIRTHQKKNCWLGVDSQSEGELTFHLWLHLQFSTLNIRDPLLYRTQILSSLRGSEKKKRTWLLACPSDKQLSNFACPGQVLVNYLFFI